MSDQHKRGDRKHNFCTQPSESKCPDCPCDKNYIKVCEPDWFGHTFKRLVKAKAGAFTFEKKYEAHHIVCVAPATDHLLGQPTIQGAIAQTKWCINNGTNMMAMPLWGHTVKWYCSFTALGGLINPAAEEPPFKDIPQHDFDHNCKGGYTSEVEEEVKKLAKEVEQSGHKLQGDSLAGALDDLADLFRERLLDERGVRKGGTHEGWKLGRKDPDDKEWCHPFSMASDAKVSQVGFPVRNFDAKVSTWIDRIANAISG